MKWSQKLESSSRLENQKEIKLLLKKSKMRNVSSISIFIDSNYGSKTTKISNLKIF